MTTVRWTPMMDGLVIVGVLVRIKNLTSGAIATYTVRLDYTDLNGVHQEARQTVERHQTHAGYSALMLPVLFAVEAQSVDAVFVEGFAPCDEEVEVAEKVYDNRTE